MQEVFYLVLHKDPQVTEGFTLPVEGVASSSSRALQLQPRLLSEIVPGSQLLSQKPPGHDAQLFSALARR